MPDHEENLPGDAEENQDGTEGDATEPEDLSGLKSALGRLKEDRKTLKQELADSKAENTFLASLPAGTRNPKAVRVLAQEFGMVREDGTLDATAFKKEFPHLLTGSTPSANAGEGTATPPAGKSTMNEWIRQQSGT